MFVPQKHKHTYIQAKYKLCVPALHDTAPLLLSTAGVYAAPCKLTAAWPTGAKFGMAYAAIPQVLLTSLSTVNVRGMHRYMHTQYAPQLQGFQDEDCYSAFFLLLLLANFSKCDPLAVRTWWMQYCSTAGGCSQGLLLLSGSTAYSTTPLVAVCMQQCIHGHAGSWLIVESSTRLRSSKSLHSCGFHVKASAVPMLVPPHSLMYVSAAIYLHCRIMQSNGTKS
jgi:hypothetical protein